MHTLGLFLLFRVLQVLKPTPSPIPAYSQWQLNCLFFQEAFLDHSLSVLLQLLWTPNYLLSHSAPPTGFCSLKAGRALPSPFPAAQGEKQRISAGRLEGQPVFELTSVSTAHRMCGATWNSAPPPTGILTLRGPKTKVNPEVSRQDPYYSLLLKTEQPPFLQFHLYSLN